MKRAKYFFVSHDIDEVLEDITGKDHHTKNGWYVFLVDQDGNGCCHHTEPFKTEADALAAAEVTGLTYEPV